MLSAFDGEMKETVGSEAKPAAVVGNALIFCPSAAELAKSAQVAFGPDRRSLRIAAKGEPLAASALARVGTLGKLGYWTPLYRRDALHRARKSAM